MLRRRSTRRFKAKCHFVFLADPARFIVCMRMDMLCGRWQTESVGSAKQSTNASASLRLSIYCSSLSPYHSISALFIYFYLYLFYTQSYSLIWIKTIKKEKCGETYWFCFSSLRHLLSLPCSLFWMWKSAVFCVADICYIKAVSKDILNWVSGIPSVLRVVFSRRKVWPTLLYFWIHFATQSVSLLDAAEVPWIKCITCSLFSDLYWYWPTAWANCVVRQFYCWAPSKEHRPLQAVEFPLTFWRVCLHTVIR